MKRLLKLIAVGFVIAFSLTQLVACSSKIKGTYQSDDVFGTRTVYEFSGMDVSRTITTELGSKTVYGEYEIREAEEGGLSIILDFDGVGDDEKTAWEFVRENDYIEIAGIRYNKVK